MPSNLHSNVPYDCGLFFSRGSGLYSLCGPGGQAPAYLTASAGEGNAEFPALEEYRNIPSPLFMGIENSSRLYVLSFCTPFLSLELTTPPVKAEPSLYSLPSSPSAAKATPPSSPATSPSPL